MVDRGFLFGCKYRQTRLAFRALPDSFDLRVAKPTSSPLSPDTAMSGLPTDLLTAIARHRGLPRSQTSSPHSKPRTHPPTSFSRYLECLVPRSQEPADCSPHRDLWNVSPRHLEARRTLPTARRTAFLERLASPPRSQEPADCSPHRDLWNVSPRHLEAKNPADRSPHRDLWNVSPRHLKAKNPADRSPHRVLWNVSPRHLEARRTHPPTSSPLSRPVSFARRVATPRS